MNPNDYIATGKLELYVLGKLDREDELEVERMAREHSEIRAEIDKIEVALEQYAQLHAVPPPAGTLDDILERVRQDTDAGATPAEPQVVPGGGRSFTPLWILIAASAALLAGWFWNQQQTATEELDNLQLDYATLAEDCNEQAEIMNLMADQIDFLRSPASRQIILNSANEDLAPGALAAVFYNPESRQSYFTPSALPPAPAGRQYQLWAIVPDIDDPVDMGVLTFDENSTALIEVPFIDNPAAFAITLEPEGGSASPTMDQMYVIGNVS